MLFDNFLYNINRVNEQMLKTTTQMASGRRLLNLSTDPIALSKALSLKDINSRFEQYSTNINAVNGILDAEDASLSASDNLIQQMSSLLIEGVNATNDNSSRLAISKQLEAVKSEIKNSANTMFQGKYLFSGYKTQSAAITDKTQSAAITDKDNTDIKIETAENFKDINQFQSGNYTIHIKDNQLYMLNDSGKPVPIDISSRDESNVGGNELAASIDISSRKGQWIDTGRGIKIKLPADLSNADIKMTYQAGGNDLYAGDDGARNVEYSDNLSSDITLTAREIYKADNQIIKNNNGMVDVSTEDPVVPQTKLTDIRLMSALKDVALDTGDKINIDGTDHSGNLIKGSFAIASNAALGDLTNFIKTLDSTEVLENNKTLKAGGSFAVSTTKLSSIGITSSITFSGLTHSSIAVSTVFNITSAATLGSLASFISSNFNVDAYIAHGKIEIEDKSPGDSKLSIKAQTSAGEPVLGMFNETSIGGSGGFADTTDVLIKNGHLYIKDKRAGTSKINISFNVKNASGDPKSNVFGLFNVDSKGGGVDVFRTLSDAGKALENPDLYSQISEPTSWVAGSTLAPTLSGYYLGGINDRWTVKVTQGSGLSNAGDEAKLSVEGQNSTTGNNKIADIDIIKTNNGYDVSVFNQDGILITNYKNVSDLSNIVIQTKNASDSFGTDDIGVNGDAGVTLSLSNAGLKTELNDGDSFSFGVSNILQDAIAKSKESLDQILDSRAIVGARTNRFKLAQDRITTTQVSNKKSISELEDANMAEVFANYQKEQIIMQATLNFGSKLSQNNLFSYI